ncbi:hypothetical protein SXCC_00191 [Gluconacetobacter sp. SXCC-1]|jgi:hypothetical protein|nr:hypothetical protein SXCC_00191 [Gluconacetobacter sp. SXCC-1]
MNEIADILEFNFGRHGGLGFSKPRTEGLVSWFTPGGNALLPNYDSVLSSAGEVSTLLPFYARVTTKIAT